MTLFKRLIFLQILLVCCSWIASAERVMRPKFTDIKLWSDTAYLTHDLVFEPNVPYINATLDLLQDLHDVDMHIESKFTQKKDSTYFASFNSTINLCRILHWRNASPIGVLLSAYLKEYGNILKTCPIVKDKYYMHKFWVPEDPATATFPEIDFEIDFLLYHVDATQKRTLIINDHIAGEGVIQDVTNVNRGILAMLPKGRK